MKEGEENVEILRKLVRDVGSEDIRKNGIAYGRDGQLEQRGTIVRKRGKEEVPEGEFALTRRIRRSFLDRWTEFSCSPSQALKVFSLFSTNVFQQ